MRSPVRRVGGRPELGGALGRDARGAGRERRRRACVLLIGSDFPHDTAAEMELLAGLPFINSELVDLRAFRLFTERTFATDRNLVPKGMVEVISWP